MVLAARRPVAPADRRLQAKLADALAETGPEVMFVTSPVELHPDHRALALALQRTLRRWSLLGGRRRQPAWVAAYEVGTVLRPNLLVDGDSGWEAKRRAGACYASQLEFRGYDAAMEALGTWRCLTLDGCERAEAFHLLPVRTAVRRLGAGLGHRDGFPRRRGPRPRLTPAGAAVSGRGIGSLAAGLAGGRLQLARPVLAYG